jgi:hypothetical protein
LRLCFLASLLLCDEIILTQRGGGAERQRGGAEGKTRRFGDGHGSGAIGGDVKFVLFVIEMWRIVVVFVAKM